MIAIAKDLGKIPSVEIKEEKIEPKKGKQIGILGGTFNPVHSAHLIVGEQVYNKLHLDEVWFIPTNIPPLKDSPTVSPQEPTKIAQMATLVGIKRAGYPTKAELPMIWVDVPSLDVSSTSIRQTIAMGGSIRYLVPDTVRNYIQKKELYHE